MRPFHTPVSCMAAMAICLHSKSHAHRSFEFSYAVTHRKNAGKAPFPSPRNDSYKNPLKKSIEALSRESLPEHKARSLRDIEDGRS